MYSGGDITKIAGVYTSITLAKILNALAASISNPISYLSNLGYAIAKELEKEMQYQAFENWLEEQGRNTNSAYGINQRVGERYRSTYLIQAMKKNNFTPPKWLNKGAMRALGGVLLTLGAEATGYYTIESGRTTPAYICPTPAFADAWERNEQHLLDSAKKYPPMIVPPAEWTGINDGGYYGELAAENSLLRLKYEETLYGKKYAEKLSQLEIPMIYKAVNTLQATPWTINKQVLEVVKDCRKNGYLPWGKEGSDADYIILLSAGLPPQKDKEDMTEEELKAYKKKCADWYKGEKRRLSLQNRANTIVNIADKFSVYEKIYFPWNMDFRGRMYPIPTFSPQGDDLNKGLLLFADAPSCSSEGAFKFLQITVADLAGVDKVSYADRIKWVETQEENILLSAKDPMGYQWWLHQDKKPVQLLAACFEYAKAKQYMSEHNGSIIGFVTGLPYAQDGTCSGLQHFSAILRDTIGGTAVNLIPQDKPNDIYAQVAEKVNSQLKIDAVSGTADSWNEEKQRPKFGSKTLSQLWLNFGVNRKVTKRPVMTFAYGARKRGYINQILDDTIQPAIDHKKAGCPFTDNNKFQAAQYLANLIWDAVGTTVVKAAEGMEWLHEIAKQVTKSANVVTWCTPLGLLLQQSYTKYDVQVVKLNISGKRYRIYTPYQTGEIDKGKQVNGVAPNFIHSMDACHLQLTVCNAVDAGINHFTMVHDSYGCPIAQAALMYKIVRQSFVDLYTQHDVLEEFRDWLQPLVSTPLPLPPAKGELKLEDVLDSKYIFC